MTAYTGRVGSIVTAVARQFGDTGQEYVTDADCLAWINEALYELAEVGYFTKIGTFDVVADTETYVLTTELTDLMTLYSLVWVDTKAIMVPAASWEQYLQYRQGGLTGTPTVYAVRGTTLYVYPVPSTSVTNGFQATHSYAPTAQTGATPTDTPPTPAAWDRYYVECCLYRAFQRREADNYQRTNLKAPEYHARAMQLQGRLLSGVQPKMRLTPYR